MRVRHPKPIAVIGLSAGTIAAALLIMIDEGSPDSGTVAGTDMSTGVTVTEGPGVADTTVPVSRAVPGITGPAELPKEEEGLPGR